MALTRPPGFISAVADDPAALAAGYLTPSRHNLPGTVSGAIAGAIPWFDSTTSEATSALLAANGVVVGGGAGAAPSTSANLTFNGSTLAVTGNQTLSGSGTGTSAALYLSNNPAYINGAGDLNLQRGSTTQFSLISGGNSFGNQALFFGAAAGGFDSGFMRAGVANSLIFGNAVTGAGLGTSRTEINKAVTGISDAVATAVFTVTVPNAAHSASIRVRLTGSLGAGGAIGANESTQDAEYMINVARTSGVNAVATIGAVVGQAAAASVAGANNAAVVGTLSAISGAVGVTNTFTINVTITKSAGSSANHTCLAFAELLNANATGVTIA